MKKVCLIMAILLLGVAVAADNGQPPQGTHRQVLAGAKPVAVAADNGQPPQGVPVWLWTILGVVLPWVYATFIGKLKHGWLKWLVTWGLSAVIVIAIGLVIFHFNIGQLLESMAWLVMVMQAVYELCTKPAAKKLNIGPPKR